MVSVFLMSHKLSLWVKKIQWNADRVVSISAIIVSMATLIIILYQTSLMRQEQRASVMPSLTHYNKISYSSSKI